jgi:hypothetical protein
MALFNIFLPSSSDEDAREVFQPLMYILFCGVPRTRPSPLSGLSRLMRCLQKAFRQSFVANISRADDHFLSPEEEASFNVDALVNDPVTEQQGETPLSSQVIEETRRIAPKIPPGFSVPVEPNFVVKENLPLSTLRNASSTITPAIPAVPTTPVRPTTPIKAKKERKVTEASEPSSTNSTTIAAPRSIPTTPAKSSHKVSAKSQVVAETPKGKSAPASIAEQRENTHAVSASPSKGTPKGKVGGRKSQNPVETSPQKDVKQNTKDSTSATMTTSSKRQHPGKLDIAAATKASDDEQTATASSTRAESQPKAVRVMSTAVAQSVPGSPAAILTGSPIKRSTGAKTLRVIATPKTETPPPLSAGSLTSLPQVPNVEKLRSRQASVASLYQPGTPVSELVSDTASVTSTSLSRANSPPPVSGKVGTAPIRKKTKSQQKKDRQERARQADEERVTAIDEEKSEPEVVQAPIVGRKKKAKKPAPANPKPVSVPTKSQPVSPKPVEMEGEQDQPEPVSALPTAQAVKASVSSPHIESVDSFEQSRDKREISAQSVIADLQRTGELIASTLEFFKPLSSSLAHASRAAQASGGPVAPPDLKVHFSEADLDALAKKKPVRLNGHDGKSDSRTLITPQGKFFWGLTQELEEKALELEKHIEELKGAARFHGRRQASHQQHATDMPLQTQSKDILPALATALKEAGAKLSKSAGQPMPKLDPTSLLSSSSLPLPPVQAPSDLPPPQHAQQQQTPADAGTYLNQFVLPKTDNPPPNTPRPEMAAVGGPPGAGTANVSVNVNKIAKAAKAVAEGGAVGTELEGMGVMAADPLGGVFVQGLEALVGAGLGFSPSNQDLSLDSNGNISVSNGSQGLDVQGLVNAFEAGVGFGGRNGKGRRNVLNIEEAEQAMLAARKDHEALEKKLVGLMKRNKKLVGGR